MSIRRVVTGHNAEGRSCFISDEAAPNVFQRHPGSTHVTELWKTFSTPADNADASEPSHVKPSTSNFTFGAPRNPVCGMPRSNCPITVPSRAATW